MGSSSYSLLSAIAYSDLFNFPLTRSELWRYAGPGIRNKKQFEVLLRDIPHLVCKDQYICLKGNEAIIRTRIKYESHVRHLQKKAARIAWVLGCIPWVQCICLSGSLAAGQYRETDDIDLFVITKVDTLWISRFCLVGMVSLLGKRRRKSLVHAPGSICLNMFADMNSLTMSILGKDIYIAREIAQLKVLVNKGQTFEHFMGKNTWVNTFLPHVKIPSESKWITQKTSTFIAIVNKILQRFQETIMEKTRTTELITDHLIALHPGDYHERILREFEAKMHTIPH